MGVPAARPTSARMVNECGAEAILRRRLSGTPAIYVQASKKDIKCLAT